MEKGREEGREEAIGQGEARVLLRLLTLKFGPLPEAVRVAEWSLPTPRRSCTGPNGC
jgi:predicted transposase YdaD